MGADKDVDGFHPLNAGRLALRGWLPTFVPCTPKGCMELLRRANLPVAGRTAVVLGNSNTVGTPLAMLMRDCGAAAVTVCHKAAADNGAQLAALTRTADVLVAAVGRANLVRGGWIKPGAVVIDVGINVVPTRSASVVGGPMAVVHHGPMLETGPWREEGDYRRVSVSFQRCLLSCSSERVPSRLPGATPTGAGAVACLPIAKRLLSLRQCTLFPCHCAGWLGTWHLRRPSRRSQQSPPSPAASGAARLGRNHPPCLSPAPRRTALLLFCGCERTTASVWRFCARCRPMTIAALLDNMLIAWTGLEGIALEDARAPPAAAPAAAAAGGGAA